MPVSTVSAETILVPGIEHRVRPLRPDFCATRPTLCRPGPTVRPIAPGPGPAPAPAPRRSGGFSKDQMLGLGIVGGVIAGAAIANATRPREVIVQPQGNANAHVDWCFGRYRSYRIADNTFQPYHGPRRQCISPYI
ncbi:BA14K family protein [Oricola cellulosilytica]|uniref:Lectin-like protein BA14k n=2 Tax=Oricola cellulosilytica TaxID=1429082 RepID=A0A4R0PEK8_9HYPH|nr:BA14K family protein [Oricola cellulosilytica]